MGRLICAMMDFELEVFPQLDTSRERSYKERYPDEYDWYVDEEDYDHLEEHVGSTYGQHA